MSITLVVFWALFLCIAVAVIIITFPSSFARDSMEKGLRKIQQRFIYANIVACVLIGIANNPPNYAIKIFFIVPSIDVKIALLLIPVVACIVFSIALYYPSVRFLVKSNLKDQIIIDQLITLIFNCAYGENDNREKALNDFDIFCTEQKAFIDQYGLNVYLVEYKNHTNTISFKPPLELTKYVLDRCSQVKCEINNFDPAPFPNIGLVLSFIFSTVLTVLLSIVTINM